MDENRQKDLADLAERLFEQYPQYSAGVRYLRTLSGEVARRPVPPPRINFLTAGPSPPLQRGNPVLEHPEPFSVHKLKVGFQRHQ